MTASTATPFHVANRSRPTCDAFISLAELEFRLGDWHGAYASAVEALRLAHAVGAPAAVACAMTNLALVEAGLGWTEACRRHGNHALELAPGGGPVPVRAREALGLLELGLGELESAIAWLEPLIRSPHSKTGEHDLIEALVRRGDRDRAARLLALRVQDTPSASLNMILARSQGLVAGDDEFELHFTSALEKRLQLGEPFERARTELCFGQRLRRAGRREDARACLSAALTTFERLAAAHWAGTARRELGASAQRARRRVDSTRDELTAQERQVAEVVAEGVTNREAAGRLFISEKTIETHLGHIYRKLGLRTRTELARVFAASGLGETHGSPTGPAASSPALWDGSLGDPKSRPASLRRNQGFP